MDSSTYTFDLSLLRSFVAVVDHGSFARAGQALGYTQAAVSQQMQRLEAQISLPLFRRQGRNKHLTDSGMQLLRYAREMILLNDDAARALTDIRLSGILRLGAPPDVAETLLPAILGQIARSAPQLRLEIDVGRSPYLMQALERGDIDMTISTRRQEGLQGLLLRTTPTVWISATQFAPVRGHPLPLILIDEPSIFRRLAIDALDRAKIPWRLAYRASNLTGVKAAIRANLGVTARTMDLLGPDMRVLGEGLPRLADLPYYLWMRPAAANPAARQAFELLQRSGQYTPVQAAAG